MKIRKTQSRSSARKDQLKKTRRAPDTPHEQLWKHFLTAWNELWEEVKQHPAIIGYRETHVHVLLGHHLLKTLQSTTQFTPYDHCDIRFDEHTGIEAGGYVVYPLIVCRRRPDITIRIINKPNGIDTRGLAIELKCIRSVREAEDVEEDDVEDLWKDRDCRQECEGVFEDLDILGQYASQGFENDRFAGVMCVLNLHHISRKGIPTKFGLIKWQDEIKHGKFHVVRRALATVTAHNRPVSGNIIDETITTRRWITK